MKLEYIELSIKKNWDLIISEVAGSLKIKVENLPLDEFIIYLRHNYKELHLLVEDYFFQLYHYKALQKKVINESVKEQIYSTKIMLGQNIDKINEYFQKVNILI